MICLCNFMSNVKSQKSQSKIQVFKFCVLNEKIIILIFSQKSCKKAILILDKGLNLCYHIPVAEIAEFK